MNPMLGVVLLLVFTVAIGFLLSLLVNEYEMPDTADATRFVENVGNCTFTQQHEREFGFICDGRPYVVYCSNPRSCGVVE